jgi:large subunit ribosomal protein L13
MIAGRLCSHVAKLLLEGNRVSIVNSENIMISGNRESIIDEYRKFLEVASINNPKFGPFHPRRPDTIITKMARGMLPKTKSSGQAAFKRLRAYLGVPNELRSLSRTQFEDARIRKSSPYYTSLGELGRMIGWHE